MTMTCEIPILLVNRVTWLKLQRSDKKFTHLLKNHCSLWKLFSFVSTQKKSSKCLRKCLDGYGHSMTTGTITFMDRPTYGLHFRTM